MTKTGLSALSLLLAFGCSSDETKPGEAANLSQARAAIQELTARDEQTVAQCNRAVDACNARLPDASPVDVCGRLAEHCGEVQARLAEVRSEAVGCWRAVEECAEHTPEQAQCSRDPADCEAVESDTDEDRAAVVDCGVRVENCLTRAAEQPAGALAACEQMAAACERREARGADAGAGNGQGSGESDGDDDVESDGDDVESDGDDTGEDDGDGNGGRPDRPPVDRGRPADAGAPSAG